MSLLGVKEIKRKNRAKKISLLLFTMLTILIITAISTLSFFKIILNHTEYKNYQQIGVYNYHEKSQSNIFSDKNNELNVNGTNIVNSDGEKVILKGFSTSNGDVKNFDFTYYYNDESIQNLKKEGVNVLRLLYLPRHYIENKESINKVYQVIESCIKNDMYVIIDWHAIKEGDPNVYFDYAKEFFSELSLKYGKSPNILYEICNEPNDTYAGYEVNWQMICNYANEIIPIIRKNSNSIIIVGTPQSSTRIEDIDGKLLDYDNIIYALHLYSAANFSAIDKLKFAMKKDIPVFITEWGSGDIYNTKKLDSKIGNEFLYAMDYYGISWVYFELGDDENITEQTTVKKGMWDNTFNDNNLTEPGKYIFGYFRGVNVQKENAISKYIKDFAFWNDEYRGKIKTIKFINNATFKINETNETNETNTLNETNKTDKTNELQEEKKYEKIWDVSYVNGTKKVFAGIIKRNDGYYDLDIYSKNQIILPSNSEGIFSEFKNLEEIDLSGVEARYVKSFYSLFYNDEKLKKVIFGKLDTSHVLYMNYMFYGCKSLIDVDLTNLSTDSAINMEAMFSKCENINNIDVSHFNTKNVKNFIDMFYDCKSVKNINVSNFDTKSAKYLCGMFQNCSELESIDISNFKLDNCEDISYMFGWSGKLSIINLNDVNLKNIKTNVKFLKSNADNLKLYVKGTENIEWLKKYISENSIKAVVIDYDSYQKQQIEALKNSLSTVLNKNNELKNKYAEIYSNNNIDSSYKELNDLLNKLLQKPEECNLDETSNLYNKQLEITKNLINEYYSKNINIDEKLFKEILAELINILDNYEGLYEYFIILDNISEIEVEKDLNNTINYYNNNRDLDLGAEADLINNIKDVYENSILTNNASKNYFNKQNIIKVSELINIMLDKKVKDAAEKEYKLINFTSDADISKPINKDITITINLPNEKSKITNNNGSNVLTFTENGEYIFNINIRGYDYTYKVAVSNIDKTIPKLNIENNGTSIKTTVIDDDLKEIKIEKDGKKVVYNQGEEITKPGIYEIVAIDKAGNQVSSKEIVYGTYKNSDSQEIKYVPIDKTETKAKDLVNASDFIIKSEKNGTIYSNNKYKANNVNVATGDKIVKDGQEYLLVVMGDITKDGQAGVFDYLSNNFKENNKKINLNNIKVIYAGNLKKEKCPFIYELNEKKLKYSFNLYGLGIDKELLKKNKKINYRGSFDPENIEFIYGDIGLVWDGHIDESDEDESFKNYTRYNNPHKLSCYIARGLPVIVWRKSAISEFVIKNNIGYTISNLYDINNLDFSDIEEKRKNAMVLSRKLRSGYYTKKIIDEIVEKH